MWTIHCNYLNLSIIKKYNYYEKYLSPQLIFFYKNLQTKYLTEKSSN